MDYISYISQKKEVYELFHIFIEDENEDIEDYLNLTKEIEKQRIQEDEEELALLIRLIANLSNHYHRYPFFYKKIFKIIDFLLDDIKRTFRNFELFKLIENNPLIILYFFEKQIITVDKQIAKEITKLSSEMKKNYKFFFYPEIKNFISQNEQESIENYMKEQNLKIFESFEEKRRNGENESIISEIIRNDSIIEFDIYVNKTNIYLSSQIKESIFETNSFLNKKESSLIEYATFYGSIQIVKYLCFNKVKLTPSLWIYAIHSNKPELIHFLEENNVEPPNKNYIECILHSIECHHNNITDYIRDQFLTNENKNDEDEMKIEKMIVESSNFREMPNDFNCKFIFFYFCAYKYSKLEKLYIKEKQEKIKNGMINY